MPPMTPTTKVLAAVAVVAGWEALWWVVRRQRRLDLYCQAFSQSRRLGRPLVVIGAPDLGATSGYPPGDYTIDIRPSNVPNFIQADICKDRLPFNDNSVVVVVECVLEYVDDYASAFRELRRIAGSDLYICRVEPWTLAAYLYPGRQRTLPAYSQPNPALSSKLPLLLSP